jgi:large subunit ribosomal protein L25
MSIKLEAQPRMVHGKAVKRLRAEGKVPAVLYGHGIKPRSIFILYNPLGKVWREAGESTLVDLSIDGEEHKVLIADVQHHPLSGAMAHVDFREVKMTEKLEADIHLKFVGEARAVKEAGGILIKNLTVVKVRCLPQYLVHEIEVDLSPLAEFGNTIHVSDIRVPEGVELLVNPREVVATVTAPREEEAAPAPAEVDLSAIKTVGEEKKAAKEAEKKAEEAAEKETKK